MQLVAQSQQFVIKPELAKLIEKLQLIRTLGYSFKEIQNFFIKEELTALLLHFVEKSEANEIVFDEFEILAENEQTVNN